MAEAYLKSKQIPGLTATSSGTAADRYRTNNIPTIRNSKQLLQDAGIADYAKPEQDQLVQERLVGVDLVICVNDIAYEEARSIVDLPKNTIVWSIVDVGEGDRIPINDADILRWDRVIFTEVVQAVDRLVAQLYAAGKINGK